MVGMYEGTSIIDLYRRRNKEIKWARGDERGTEQGKEDR